MSNRTARRSDQDLRDYPTYTIPEAAAFLAMPARTLRFWVTDKPLWSVAGDENTIPLLSFKDLAQSYFIDFIRKHVGLSGRQARVILAEARKESKSQYPLLDKDIKVFFKHILMDKPPRGTKPRRVVDLTRQGGQLSIPEVIDLFATRIRFDNKGRLAQIFPWRYWSRQDMSTPVMIDPGIMSGRLVITGTRIPVQIVAQRKLAGEAVTELAKDYGLEIEAVDKALRHLALRKAA
jgi:uncharacterized protein (DUF433 family)/DNA-binding transcriptional MerR regulator